MPVTYTLIASNTLSSAAASVTFSAIPGTHTDLVLRYSARSSSSGISIRMTFNGSSSTVYSRRHLSGEGSSIYNYQQTSGTYFNDFPFMASSSYTSNTFNSAEIYIPSYTASANKPVSAFYVVPDNTTGNMLTGAIAGLFSSTSAITSITLTDPSGNFVSGSSFFLYGIKNS